MRASPIIVARQYFLPPEAKLDGDPVPPPTSTESWQAVKTAELGWNVILIYWQTLN